MNVQVDQLRAQAHAWKHAPKIVIEFDPEIPKSHTADKPTAPLGRFTEY